MELREVKEKNRNAEQKETIFWLIKKVNLYSDIATLYERTRASLAYTDNGIEY